MLGVVVARHLRNGSLRRGTAPLSMTGAPWVAVAAGTSASDFLRAGTASSSSSSSSPPPSPLPVGTGRIFGGRNFSSYSSFDEPHPTLFASSQLSVTATSPDEMDADFQLRKDIRMMGSLLGQVIKDHGGGKDGGQNTFAKVEEMRALAKKWREAGAGRYSAESISDADKIMDQLADCACGFTDRELFLVSRAFTHFLALANAAESHHRARRASLSTSSGGLYDKPDSCGGVLPDLLDRGFSSEDIFNALTTQTTELVLTAHPTEVNRRTILDKKRRIQDILTAADTCRSMSSASPSPSSSSFVMDQLDDDMYREISSIWLSDEVSRVKPTPQTEAEKGVLVIETVLWESVPSFLRKLDATVSEYLGKRLPLDCAPVKFASWMGGDRDGNPNVKPNTTREVCVKNRAKAASLFQADLMKLHGELSISTCSKELRALVGDAREPYREFLAPIVHKMKRTKEWARTQVEALQSSPDTFRAGAVADGDEGIYLSRSELMEELMLIHRSLCETGNEITADGTLTDILRNLSAFGLTLVPLDVRQESDRHEEAVDSITRFLGLGSYSEWDEQTRISWLTTQIASKRPLLRSGVWRDHPDIFSPTACDTLEISQMIAEQHEDSLGAYVISQATSASDVLAVLLLQLDAG